MDHGALDEIRTLIATGPGATPVCVVLGGSGSGRTSLVRDLAEECTFPVQWVDGSAYAGRGHLESLVDLAHSRAFAFLGITADAETAGLLADPSGVDPQRVARDLWRAAQGRTAVDQPRLVVVDDFDALDIATQEVLVYLLRRVGQLDMSVVIVGHPTLRESLLRGLSVVELRPLDVDQTRAQLEALVDAPVPYRVAAQICHSTGGVPLAIASVADRLTPAQRAGLDLLPHPLPLNLTTARRLAPADGLSAGQRRLLAALAIEGSLRRDQAAVLAGDEPIGPAVDLGLVKVADQVLRPVSPTQALAVWSVMPESERWGIHRRLAATADAACARLHRALSGEEVSRTEVADAAIAAYHGEERTHVAMALQLLSHALPSGAFPVAAMLFADGYIDTVRSVVAAADSASCGLSTVEVDWLRTQVAVLSGVGSDSVPGTLPPPVSGGEDRRVWALSAINRSRAQWHRGDLDAAARTLDDTAAAFLDAPADLRSLAKVVRAEIGLLRHEAWARSGLSVAVEAWWVTKPPGYDINASIVAYMLLSVGNARLAGTVLDASEPIVEPGALVRVGIAVSRIHVELALGHYRSADALLVACDRVMPYLGDGSAHVLAPQVQVNTVLGLTAGREVLEWRLRGDDIYRLPYPSRSDVAAALGLRAMVEADFERAAVLLRQALGNTAALYDPKTAVLADLLEASRAAGGSAERAAGLLDTLGAWLPDRDGERYPALIARCEALACNDSDADATFERATSLASGGPPVDEARTRLAHGRHLRDVGRLHDAMVALRGAATIFEREGLAGWTAHVAHLTAPPPEALDSLLSAVERQIVRMALDRRTNAQIAGALYMSKRTVELHLTRIFRKLGISRKGQLGDLDLSLD